MDDEEPARENLRFMLRTSALMNVSGMADGASSARRPIEELDPELVFLDIRMPSGTEGLDLLASPRRASWWFSSPRSGLRRASLPCQRGGLHPETDDPDELRLSVDRALTGSVFEAGRG